MSSLNLPLVLSEAAKADIVDILQYTRDTWGDAQVLAYSAVIDKAFSNLREHPYLGRKVPEISERHRALKAGQHIIFYTLTETSIQVARILHHKMDIQSRF